MINKITPNEKATILVVDDTSESLALLVGMLTAHGYQVRPADSGELALAAVAAEPPDLILLDIRLPGMDGLEVTQRLKAQPETSNIPVILITATFGKEGTVEGLLTGAADYITKPFLEEELLARIQTHLALGRANISLERQADALRQANAQLQAEIVARQRVENELRQNLEHAERSRLAMLSSMEDQKRMENKLRQAKEYAEKLISTANAIIVGLDVAGNVQVFNETAKKITGYTRADLEGKNWFEVLVPKDRYPYVWEEFAGLTQNGAVPRTFENPILTKSGEERTISWQNSELCENGNITGTISFGIDITEQVQVEEALRESENAMVEAQQIAQIGSWEYDIAMDKPTWSKQMFELFGRDPSLGEPSWQEHRLSIHPDDWETLDKAVSSAEPYKIEFRILHPTNGERWAMTIGQVEKDETGQAVKLKGTVQDITERKQAEAEIQSLAKFPAENPNPVLRVARDGTLLYINPSGSTLLTQWQLQIGQAIPPLLQKPVTQSMNSGTVDTIDLRHGESIFAFTIASVVDAGYANLYARDITARKRVEDNLRESEKLWRLSIEHMLEGYALHEAIFNENGRMVDYRFLEFNPAAQKISNIARAAIVGRTALELFPHVTERGLLNRYADAIATGVPAYIEDFYYAGDSLDKALDISCFRIDELHFVCVFRDITERKRAEEALKKSRIDYKHIFDNANDVILVFEPKQELILEVNAAACAVYGFDRDELVGMSLKELTKDRAKGEAQISALIKSGTYRGFESVHFNKKREDIHFLINASVVEYQGRKAILSINRDITERKRAESALRESKQIIEGIINTIPARVFWKDKNLVYLGCNMGFARDAGFADPKHIIGKDDYQMAWRDQAELYRGDDRQVIESGFSKLHIEEPQTTPEGNTITRLTNKVPLQNFEGEIIGLLGTYMDITERKQAEIQIEEQLTELQRWYSAMLGRESRVSDLKREVNELLAQSGQPPRYHSAALENGSEGE